MREARPITTQNPSVGLYRFATAFAGHREHVALQRQPCASAWQCRHTPFRGFQNVREARPITTQNPSVGLYRFATAFPGHRTHVALQRQPCASAWPCRHNPFTALPLLPPVTAAPGHVARIHLEGVKTCVKHGPSGHKTPLWAFTALPLLSQVTANTLPCSASRLPAPWRCHVAIIHFLLSRFTPLPAPCQVTDLSLLGLVLPCVSEAPLGSLPCYPPFSFTGPSRWCAMLDVDSSGSTCWPHNRPTQWALVCRITSDNIG